MKIVFTVLYSFLLLCFCADLQAQSNTLSAGGNASGTGGNSSYSIGTIDYISSDGSGGQVSQGLQQPFELFVTEVKEAEESISARLFPNPSVDFVAIEVPANGNSGLRYRFTDLQGKEIGQGKITGLQTLIPLSGLSTGSYFITLFRNQSKVKTFQLVKNQ